MTLLLQTIQEVLLEIPIPITHGLPEYGRITSWHNGWKIRIWESQTKIHVHGTPIHSIANLHYNIIPKNHPQLIEEITQTIHTIIK